MKTSKGFCDFFRDEIFYGFLMVVNIETHSINDCCRKRIQSRSVVEKSVDNALDVTRFVDVTHQRTCRQWTPSNHVYTVSTIAR